MQLGKSLTCLRKLLDYILSLKHVCLKIELKSWSVSSYDDDGTGCSMNVLIITFDISKQSDMPISLVW